MTVKQRIRIVVPAVIIGAGIIWAVSRSEPGAGDLASGTVEATEAILGFQHAGRIATVSVREGEEVQAGDTVAVLNLDELHARREAAVATLTAARAALAELEAGSRQEEIEQARAMLRAADEQVMDATRDVERTRRLVDGGALSQETLDKARTALAVAAAERDRAREQVALVEQGPRQERIAAQRARVEQATASLHLIEASISNATVVAPFAGIITVRHRIAGEIVGAGTPVVTLMDPSDRWVRIYVREDAVGRLTLGQEVAVTGDAFPDRSYQGEVAFIASEAEFTPRNVQTTEERVKLVYEVRVRITGDPSLDLKPGLAADVRFSGA